ncbi:BAF_collapsed_G0023180.mRNA.1.CDS.1 [Saccharomyces cerevisiae]|nr:CFA_G0022790.mRNA.1.CDS.1 [Saccharomyces cerevisiae]CAI5280793.1 BAF_HP2_G0022580.mRNA.1.CDS.1 [Saccharomyces cerevisiae]CAI6527973.1 BAF_HP1_G0022920.mRNA.1.CDS.1 [Saccharomyces cerevisiae]CAI6553561.1 BAF_HP2_G0022580.mRNA.1.CDS.1 [Saccharomyces cerevisiae]CAI7171709.1 BAF_collapsed_G0023180.mRNA.1.CDS.1 [Saccharomyces cerevisiae]
MPLIHTLYHFCTIYLPLHLYTLMSILQKNPHKNHLNIKISYSSTIIHKHIGLW